MNKLQPDFAIEKYGVYARLVNENDAEFIVKLRTDSLLSRFIHPTSPDINEQKRWINKYKEREKNGLDFYFIFFHNNEPFGLNRLYNIKWEEKKFTSGSWLCKHGTPTNLVVASSLIPRILAFEQLNMELEDGFDGVHENNVKVIKFNEMMGMVRTGSIMDEKGKFFTYKLEKEAFEINKLKMERLLGLNI